MDIDWGRGGYELGELEGEENGKEQREKIIGNLKNYQKGYAYEEKIAMQVFDADYNQIDAQLLDDDSELYKISPDFTLFWLCTEKLYSEFCQNNVNKAEFANFVMERLERYWKLANEHYNTKILQFNFMLEDDRIFGIRPAGEPGPSASGAGPGLGLLPRPPAGGRPAGAGGPVHELRRALLPGGDSLGGADLRLSPPQPGAGVERPGVYREPEPRPEPPDENQLFP